MMTVSVRTLHDWEHKDPGRLGRPPTPARACRAAYRAVLRDWKRQGRGAGWRPVAAALGGRVSTYRVQSSLREGKKRWRRRKEGHAQRQRTSVAVHARDAIWSIDAAQLGYGPDGPVQGQAVRDPASRATPAVWAGASPTADDVIAVLDEARAVRGTLPLVATMDNGPPYRSRKVRDYLAQHRVVPLYNLPRTPQHNAFVERAIGELRQDSGLCAQSLLPDAKTAAGWWRESATRLDEERLRATLGYRTAAQADSMLPRAPDRVDRDRFYEEACCARRHAVLGCKSVRARRRAERNSICATLENFDLITRTRGGAPLASIKPEVFS